MLTGACGYYERTLSSKSNGSFLILEYQKSSATLSLATQLLVDGKLLTTNTAVRSLGGCALGGQRFLVPQYEAPAQCTPAQRAQQKNSPAL